MQIPFPKDSPLNFNLNQSSEIPLTEEQLLRYIQENPEVIKLFLQIIKLK